MKKVFKAYLDQGELTGTTMAAIFNEIEADYVGIEDWSLFEEGYSFYLDAQNQTNDLKVKIEVKEKELHEQKKDIQKKRSILTGCCRIFAIMKKILSSSLII